MNVNWILSFLLFPLYYFLGFIVTALITILDGFVGTFTRYHCILLMISITISLFNVTNIFWGLIMVIFTYLATNYDYMTKQYITLKRTTENTLKMINLEKKMQLKKTQLTQSDMLMIENTNKMFIYVDNIMNYTQSFYNYLKFKLVYFFNKLFKYGLCDYLSAKCQVVNITLNNAVTNSLPIMYDNAIILYELLLDVQPIGKYVVKVQKYYNCCLLLNKQDDVSNTITKTDTINMDQLNDMNNLIEGLFANMPDIKSVKSKSKQLDPMKFMSNIQNFNKPRQKK